MKPSVDPLTGRVQLLPRQKKTGGGTSGSYTRTSFANLVSSDPADAAEGDLVYNTTEGALKIYYNGAWVAIGSSVAGSTFDFMDNTDYQFMDDTYFDFMDA